MDMSKIIASVKEFLKKFSVNVKSKSRNSYNKLFPTIYKSLGYDHRELEQNQYMILQDKISLLSRMETGCKSVYFRKNVEKVKKEPTDQIILQANKYCVIKNPINKDENNQPIRGADGHIEYRHGQKEIRLSEHSPFPLYLGEKLEGGMNGIKLIERLEDDEALLLEAIDSFTDTQNIERHLGDKWLFYGRGPYIPRVEVKVNKKIKAIILDEDECCIVKNPVDSNGKVQLGKSKMIYGPKMIFEHSGQTIEKSIDELKQKMIALTDQEGLLLKALEPFTEDTKSGKIKREAGEKWLLKGPYKYVPQKEVEKIETRNAIPLDTNEGIYVKDTLTGSIELVRGPQMHFLAPHQEPWKKKLPSIIEELLVHKEKTDSDSIKQENSEQNISKKGKKGKRNKKSKRDKSRAVTYHVPHNAAIQVHNSAGVVRTIFGPELIMLNPDEKFTILSLSGSRPKKEDVIKTLVLRLGPDFMTDIFTVETSDHARLKLQLSYNWHFDVDKNDQLDAAKLFHVPDFVGAACKAIASRVRGALAAESYEEFHKNSTRIIRLAVFGEDDEGRVKDEFRFSANNLVITNIDIQSIQLEDENSRKRLDKSVNQAISAFIDAKAARAQQKTVREEQDWKARLEKTKIENRRQAEEKRKELLEQLAENKIIEISSKKAAQAHADARVTQINSEVSSALVHKDTEAARIRFEQQLAQERELNELEIDKARRLAEISSEEYEQKVKAIGSETIEAIAKAGPEMQAKLLEGLGIQSILIMDGKNPINLFNTANSLIDPMLSKNGPKD